MTRHRPPSLRRLHSSASSNKLETPVTEDFRLTFKLMPDWKSGARVADVTPLTCSVTLGRKCKMIFSHQDAPHPPSLGGGQGAAGPNPLACPGSCLPCGWGRLLTCSALSGQGVRPFSALGLGLGAAGPEEAPDNHCDHQWRGETWGAVQSLQGSSSRSPSFLGLSWCC